MIELKGVTKRYGDAVALQPTDLSFEVGQTTALIGPSGCGKSTLLRLIVGLILPTEGTVTFDGQPVNPSTAIEVRRKVGYVIQDGGLFPHLTARQNVTLMSRHLGRSAPEIDGRIAELADLTHFPIDGLDRYPLELSGGQKQRVSLMRALALKPQALLLDEPLGALDPMVRASLQTELKAIFERLRQTVVFVTHDLAEAAYLAHRIVLLNEGRIVQIGSLDELRETPADPFVTAFVNAQRSLVAL